MLKKISAFIDSKKKRNLFFTILGVFIFLVSNQNGMFWDNILFGSKMGNQLYYNSVFNWTMPDEFDPGHPPFLGFLLALFWNVLGHKLWVAHLAILPFTIGFLYQLYRFISFYIDKLVLQVLAFILIIADPTLGTSFVLVNPEIIIIFFFFLTINSVLYKDKTLKFIGLFFLSIVSFRSMMLFAGIFLFDIINQIWLQKQKVKTILNIKFLLFYFSASIPAFIYVGWRLLTKGWLQTHPNSPWVDYWHYADFDFFIRNCIVLIWRYLDFGRVFIMLFLVISFFLFGKKMFQSIKKKQLLLLAFSSVIVIICTVLITTNAFGHRYFIVSYICFNLFAFIILNEFYQKRKIIFTFLFLGLVTGNFWVYPKSLSHGWNATLGHLPYHSLRLEAIDYLNKKQIKIENVGSFFPNYISLDLIDLKGDKRSFTKFNGKNKYVFNATVFNLSEEEQKILAKNYTILKQFNNFNINITIHTIK
jgi:hypothetical protein